MKAKNLMYIKQILYLLERFVAMLGGKQAVPPSVGACGLRVLPPSPSSQAAGRVAQVRCGHQLGYFCLICKMGMGTGVCPNPSPF